MYNFTFYYQYIVIDNQLGKGHRNAAIMFRIGIGITLNITYGRSRDNIEVCNMGITIKIYTQELFSNNSPLKYLTTFYVSWYPQDN